MGKKKRSKPFVSRWQAHGKTLQVAAAGVAKVEHATVKGLVESLKHSVDGLTVPERSALAWGDLRLAVAVAGRIERSGVVTGLSPTINDSLGALDRIYQRCMVDDGWHHEVPSDADMEILRELCDVHAFQLDKLTAREFARVSLQGREEMRGIHVPPIRAIGGTDGGEILHADE
jgi:hypothetical protein